MFNKIATYIGNNFFNVFLGFLIVINILPLLAPLFAHWGWNLPAGIIYNIYSFFCHQFSWRSLHLYDYQCAWCTRDVFIWGSLLVIALLVKFRKIEGIKWYWVIPFAIPMAFDGGVQTIATILGFNSADPVYMSTNFMRMVTGAIFGTGLGLWMLPMVNTLTELELNEKTTTGN